MISIGLKIVVTRSVFVMVDIDERCMNMCIPLCHI